MLSKPVDVLSSRLRQARGVFGSIVVALTVAALVLTTTPAASALDLHREGQGKITAAATMGSNSEEEVDILRTEDTSAGDEDGESDVVSPRSTTVMLTPPVVSIEHGTTVTFTVTVVPAEAAGTVQLVREDEKPLAGAVTLQDGVATLTTVDLPIGPNEIFAVFTPDDARLFEGSRSSAARVSVTGEVTVKGATFDWGVRASFRNYLTGKIAKGTVELLGSSVSGRTTPPFPQGFTWGWSGGSGAVNSSGQSADVTFGDGSGLHFLGHEMAGGHALDLRFTNPRVTVESATSGKLYFDVKSRKFDGMTSISDEFFEKKNVHLANLTLGAAAHNASTQTFTWTDAGAKLTRVGAEAFGGFYSEADELDPVSFTLPYDFDGEIVVPEQTSTQTTLSASATEVQHGTSITLTAKATPAIDGTIKFLQGDTELDSKQAVNGSAIHTLTSPSVGLYRVQAVFMPSDSEKYAHSFSNTLELVVNEKKDTKKDEVAVRPSGTESAGSLTWGISDYFVGYTTQKSNTPACPTPSRHCAGGSITTSGVGAGWLFPQASADWDDKAQTGTVNFAGSVAFNGYGMRMFQVTSPSITVHSASSATLNTGYSGSYGPSSVKLNLGAASKSVGAGGEVTWSNVPVIGGLSGISAGQSMNFDSLSFTVGSTSGVSFGATSAGSTPKAKRAPAARPPATSGITILTDPDKLRPGGRIEMEASGFAPNNKGVLVVLYSDPMVLDEEAAADGDGTVRWSGTLPHDLTEGEHTITLQGSIDAGAIIKILTKDEKKVAAAKKQLSEQQLSAEQPASAGIPGSGNGMALWEWWVSAAGLALIAACTTTLSIRQRRTL